MRRRSAGVGRWGEVGTVVDARWARTGEDDGEEEQREQETDGAPDDFEEPEFAERMDDCVFGVVLFVLDGDECADGVGGWAGG